MADRLECIALSKFYGKKHVVKDVTFSMSEDFWAPMVQERQHPST